MQPYLMGDVVIRELTLRFSNRLTVDTLSTYISIQKKSVVSFIYDSVFFQQMGVDESVLSEKFFQLWPA